jgi:hypothetical protein
MKQVLIKERKFEGKYVALRDMKDHLPVADGDNPKEVYDAAVRRGVKAPLLLFVPAQGMVHIY